MLRQSIYVILVLSCLSLILGRLHRDTRKTGKANNTGPVTAPPPSRGSSASPRANDTEDDINSRFTDFGTNPATNGKYLLGRDKVTKNEAIEQCKGLARARVDHQSITAVETDDEKVALLNKIRAADLDCVWTNSLVQNKGKNLVVFTESPVKGRMVKIFPNNPSKIPLRNPTTSKREIRSTKGKPSANSTGGNANSTSNSKSVGILYSNEKATVGSNPTGRTGGTDGPAGGTNGPAGGTDARAGGTDTGDSIIAIAQTLYPWIQTVVNGSICEFMEESCTPRHCVVETPPCSSPIDRPCRIKTPARCTIVQVDAASSGCSASCDRCSVEQPTCEVRPIPCIVTNDRRCTVNPPVCEFQDGACTHELGSCTTVQPPCSLSHLPELKKCIFGESCYYRSNFQGPPRCRRIEGRTQICGVNSTDPNCANWNEICEIPELCARPQLCRPPIVHCPAPESYCTPPKLKCSPPSVTCGQPNITCVEPTVTCPVPEVLCTQARVNCSAPAINCPVTVASCDDPELECNNLPPLACPPPRLRCDDPIECIPQQPDSHIDICLITPCLDCACVAIVKNRSNNETTFDEMPYNCNEKCFALCES